MLSTRERVLASWTDLPVAARRVLLVDLLSTAGSGIVLPFLAIYAGRVRDLGPAVGAAAVAAIAVGGLPANLAAGAAADRYGARRVLITGWVLAAAGDLVLLRSAHPVTVPAAAVLIGFGVGAAYPATSTLLAEVTPQAQRSLVFAVQYGLSNVGLSLGIGLSAVIVAVPELSRFQLLYILDAVTFLVAAAVLMGAPLRRPDVAVSPEAAPESGGYQRVAADGAFRWLCLVQVLLVVFGYAQFHAALPLYLSRPQGLEPTMIAGVFLANTLFVALAALPSGRLAYRFPPMRLITAGAACFAVSWLVLWQSRGSGWPSAGLAIVAAVVMGLGEVLLAPAVGPLVNQLSPAELRGRYNAVNALILSIGTVIGPVLVTVLYTGTAATGLFAVLTGGCLLAALLTSRRLTPERVRQASAPSHG
jgi:MFS family permease